MAKPKAKRAASTPRQPKPRARRSRAITLPMSILVPFGATFAVPPSAGWRAPWEAIKGFYSDAGKSLILGWTGWHADQNKFTNIPVYPVMIGVGAIVHKAANMLGINQTLARNRVPILRV